MIIKKNDSSRIGFPANGRVGAVSFQLGRPSRSNRVARFPISQSSAEETVRQVDRDRTVLFFELGQLLAELHVAGPVLGPPTAHQPIRSRYL